MYVRTHTHIYIKIRSTYIQILTYIHTNIDKYIPTYIHTYIYSYINTYMHTDRHTYIHT